MSSGDEQLEVVARYVKVITYFVGLLEGLLVGLLEGLLVGLFDGLLVGRRVGSL